MTEWQQRHPRLRVAIVDALLYAAAYFIAFHFALILKGLVYPPVAWGSVNLASGLLFPIAFLGVGYFQGGWRLGVAHLAILLLARFLLGSQIAELERTFGHERAFSAIWPGFLPWIAIAGFVTTTIYRFTMRKKES